MTREGYIEKIIYTNEENGYTVFVVENEDDEDVFVGNAYGIGEGMYIIAEGDFVDHPQYQTQFKFTSYELKMPSEEEGIERYLGSGIIKGIGVMLAKRIVSRFKLDTLRIIEEEPERLAEIKGITEKKAKKIATSYAEKKDCRDVIIFLSGYGISLKMSLRIFEEYGNRVYDIMRTNPYRLAEDITGVGFKAADAIARHMGIKADSDYRVRSAVLYVLGNASLNGHMYLPKNELLKSVIEITRDADQAGDYMYDSIYGYAEYESAESANSVYEEKAEAVNNQIMDLALENKIVLKTIDDVEVVYNAKNYYIELKIARHLHDLSNSYSISDDELNAEIRDIEKAEKLQLDDIQKTAIKSAISSGVAIITGGPGTGKTTIINAIIRYFGKKGMEIRLCAPTGRAAKRMTESSGWPAQTIHRLLEFSGEPSEDNRG